MEGTTDTDGNEGQFEYGSVSIKFALSIDCTKIKTMFDSRKI